MTLILNGTDNSATTPAVTGTDTDTGVYYPAANQVAIATSGTQAMLANASQGVQFANAIGVGATTPTTSGAGITFPATQSASSNANTLDDYEEGTWTPAVRGAGTAGTYTPTTADGTYTKVGRLVTASFRIIGFSTTSGGTGYMQITGVPFTNAGYACGPVRFQSLVIGGSTVMVDVEFISASGATILNFFESYNNAGGQDTPISSVSTSTSLFGTITYSAA